MLVVYFCGQLDLPELFVSVGLDLLLALDDETERREPARSIAVSRLGPNGLKIEKKPATASSPGDDARRWREGAAAPWDADNCSKSLKS